ncbi:unnamed protein product, partial [Staurois parvus]
VYRPAFTYSAPVTKTRKKRKFFPTSTILPVSKPVSLPSENPPSVVQPGASAPAIQPDTIQCLMTQCPLSCLLTRCPLSSQMTRCLLSSQMT